MIYAAQKKILDELSDLQGQYGVKTIGLYTGLELENIQNNVQSLTAIYLMQRSMTYEPFRTVKYISIPVQIRYWVLTFTYLGNQKTFNLNNNRVKDLDSLLIALRNKLIKFNTGYGYLRPQSEEILFVSDGFVGYVQEYEMEYTYKES